MPELPEVETIVRGLAPALVGARIEGVWWSGLPLRIGCPLDPARLRRLAGAGDVRAVRRRGKYILVDLAKGGQGGGVVVHLGMTGRLRVLPEAAPREPHTHVVWTLRGGRELRFSDARRFGCVIPAEAPDGVPEIAALGPDPLTELTEDALRTALAASRAPINAFLLDQRRIAGLGNIYVCEALLRAGIHPCTPARRATARAGALVGAIREVLERGIENRGTTLRDYVDADGAAGGNQAALLAYGREGAPCARCRSPIKRRVDAGRSTFFCGRCQRR
jgi:formamidopyrimidine-DNA glycosylase